VLLLQVLFPSSYASTARQVLPLSSAAVSTLSSCESTLTQALNDDVTFSQLAAGVRLLGRAKSLYSIMRKLLRLQDPAAGSRRLGQMFDLLGLRAVVLPREDLPPAEAEAAAVQACYRLQVGLLWRSWACGWGCDKLSVTVLMATQTAE
jgi:(p)ppGpp synthase/HD superfamily hydrolase